MSDADAVERLLEAAIGLGVRDGTGALTLQAIATAAGTSKALLLYHFGEKAALLRAVRARVDREATARLLAAVAAPDPMEAWRRLAREEVARRQLVLLAALALECAAGESPEPDPGRGAREEPATRLATALLRSVGLSPRVPARFLGRVLLRHLDGLAMAAAQAPFGAEELESELDAFAIALLGLGR